MTRARLLIAAALLALAAGSTSLSSGAFTATSTNPNSTFAADANFPSSCTPGTVSTVADFDKGIRSAGTPLPGGDDATLTVGTTTAGGDALFRAMVHFPLPTIPTGCTFSSATVRLVNTNAVSGRTIAIHQAMATWSEATAWPGPAFTATALSSVAAASGQMSWSVTSAISAMYSGTTNNGFLLKDSTDPTITQNGNRTQVFGSSEAPVAANRPSLVVSYQ